MLKPYKSNIADIAVIFAHVGTREDAGNRIYAIAANILTINAPPRTFQSFVRYPYLTARDRYYSNISKETLSKAPEATAIFPQIRKFLKDIDIILTLPYQDNYEDVKKISPDKRVIDLGFAVEFFMPQVDSFSPKRLWEYLNNQERKRIYFTASEVVALSIKVIEHICGKELNDGTFPRAAAIRHYLEKSNTLFGKIFINFTKNYEKYFSKLFNPCQNPDTANWKGFLETSSVKPQKKTNTNSIKKIDVEGLENIYQRLSQSVNGFTFRSAQVEYTRHVAQAINDEAVLTIEAGTGTGKTMGYLIPVMEFLSKNSDVRIAISTYTKSLQNQIFQEIEFIKDANKIYRDIPISLLKGKSNYICLEKLGNIYDETLQGQMLLTWLYFVNLAYHFRDADGEQIGHRVSHYLNDGPFFYQFQREVSARSGCDPKHTRCPAQVITAEAYMARLIITNHHKLMLLNHDPLLGGLFKIYIIDEANHFEHAVGNALGQEFNSRDTAGFVDYMESVMTKVLGRAVDELEKDIKETLTAIADLRSEMMQFSDILKKIRSQTKQSGGHQELPSSHALFKEGKVEKNLKGLRTEIQRILEHLKWLKDSDICRMLKIQDRTQERLKRNLADLVEQDLSLKIMVESLITPNRIIMYDIFSRHWTLISRPVDVSNLIRGNIYRDTRGLVYTSATICMDGNYEIFKQIVGMDRPFFLDEEATITREFRHIFLGSPFAVDRTEMIVPAGAVSGDHTNKSIWIDRIVKMLPELIKKNKGRTLVLFSSYQDLEAVAKRIGNNINEAGFPLLIQRNGFPTGDLCDEFRAVKESVLFGVDTFWYGVDFKGDTLTQVIITRIPYPHPGDALNMARKKTMHSTKYMGRYLYDTYIKMKQGIGRLIRCETDHGKVVVLDSRFLNLKDKFSTKDKNKIDAISKNDGRTNQIEIDLSDHLNDELNEPYIYHCGTCGEEISADAVECPACYRKLKQDRMPHYHTSNRGPQSFQNEPACKIKEKLPAAFHRFIEEMCIIDAKAQERGRALHQIYWKWHYERSNDDRHMSRRTFWDLLASHENIIKISNTPRIFSGIRLKNETSDRESLEFQKAPSISNKLNAKQKKAEVIQLLREGLLSSAEIAKRVGVSAPVVWGYKAHLSMGTNDSKVKRKDMQRLGHGEIPTVVQPPGEGVGHDIELENIKYLISKIPIKKPSGSITDRRIREIRQRHSRAYEPWHDQEDKLLMKLCKENLRTKMLSDIFQRQPSAITSRIKKLTEH